MYQPARFREFQKRDFEGTVDPPTIVQFQALSDGSTFRVERPLNYLMRANPDVHAQLRLLAPPKEIAIDQAGVERVVTDRPAIAIPNNLQFPIVQLTQKASFHPETSAQFFESDPRQLMGLSKLLSDQKSFARTSKTRVVTSLWQDRLGAITKDADKPDVHPSMGWAWRHEPGNAMHISVNGIRRVISFPDQVDGVFRKPLGVEYPFEYLLMDTSQSSDGDYSLVVSPNIGQIRIKPQLLFPAQTVNAENFNGLDPGGILYTLTRVNFRVDSLSLPFNEAGLAVAGDSKIGFFELPLILNKK